MRAGPKSASPKNTAKLASAWLNHQKEEKAGEAKKSVTTPTTQASEPTARTKQITAKNDFFV